MTTYTLADGSQGFVELPYAETISLPYEKIRDLLATIPEIPKTAIIQEEREPRTLLTTLRWWRTEVGRKYYVKTKCTP